MKTFLNVKLSGLTSRLRLGRLHKECTELLFSTVHYLCYVTQRLRIRDVASDQQAPQDQNLNPD